MTMIYSALIISAVAAGASAQNDYFRTTTYLKPSVEALFPKHRAGHNRLSNTTLDTTIDTRSKMVRENMLAEKEALWSTKVSDVIDRESIRGGIECGADGRAGMYECQGVDLLSFVSLKDLGSEFPSSDVWHVGWTDPVTLDEIAIIGMQDSTSFVQVTDPKQPIVLGNLPQSGDRERQWVDIKVFANHAFIIREVEHGLQVFDLTSLRELYGKPSDTVRSLEDAHVYREFGSAHNVVINEETGFAYAVGSKTCNSGLHVVDISSPKEPTFAGCYSEDGYVHDAQVVIYRGPDERFIGREIAFMYNEDTITIADVSDKANMVTLSRTDYYRNKYTHQGWLSEDMRFIISNDEADERKDVTDPSQEFTRTLLWDVSSLSAPILTGEHIAAVKSIDHNLYVKGGLAYLSNYCTGMRILDATQIEKGVAPEVAFFHSADYCDQEVIFSGSWSNFPYFESGNVVLGNMETGLFMLRPTVMEPAY